MNAPFLHDCERLAERFELPAVAVGLSVGGRDELAAVGCSPETVFRVASITKPFTASVALRELSLDAAAGSWPGVHVRELLSHTSGYDCECGDLARFGDGDDALIRLRRELGSVRQWVEPGRAWSYSNAGYWLAGSLAAEARGSSYETLVEGLVSAVDLDATSFGAPDVAGTGPGATTAAYPRARRPSGGLVSNVPDLLRFGRWLLADPGAAAMRVPLGRPTTGVYGLGLAGDRVGDSEVWGHGGSYGGFQSSFLVVPDRDAVFVGLTNSGSGRQALRELEDAFFVRVVGTPRPVPDTVELGVGQLAGFAGRYANAEQAYDVAVGDGGLQLTMPDAVLRARPIGPATFQVTEGEHVNDRFDFPLPRFVRVGGRLAERVA